MTTIEFIKKKLQSELLSVSKTSEYFAVSSVLIGIEFLGMLRDEHPLDLSKEKIQAKNSRRFQSGMTFFNDKYIPFSDFNVKNKYLYNLRNSLFHGSVFLDFILGEEKDDIELHLTGAIVDGHPRTIIVIRQLVQDFISATESAIIGIESGSLEKDYLSYGKPCQNKMLFLRNAPVFDADIKNLDTPLDLNKQRYLQSFISDIIGK